MTTFVSRDGARLTPYMFWQIERLNFDLKRLFGVEVKVTSGIRLAQEQIDIFLQRYVTAGNVRGRRVYDTRVWNGIRYYRISSAGTVAVPSTSNHEIQGTNAAVDLRDTGNSAGIATAGSPRANWLRANAWRYDMEPEGYNFNEAWHYKVRNIFNAVPGQPATPAPKPKEDGMTQSLMVDKKGLYAISEEFLSHHGTVPQAKITREVMSSQDELHSITMTQLLDLMDGLGIPRDVINQSTGEVKNPESGNYEGNGVWTRERANTARLAKIETLLAKLTSTPATPAVPKS